MLTAPNGWRARSWAVFRAVLGAYLALHFAQLLPWAGEVFARMGAATVSPLFPYVPSPLWLATTPAVATALVGLGTLASLALAWGRHDRIAAGVVLWVLACLLAANPLILNPALPHLGWMLLAHVWVPQPPDVATLWRDPDAGAAWRLPPEVFAAGWAVMTLAYAYSAWTKLAAPSWVDGSALEAVLRNPLARDHAGRTWLLAHPALLRLATWGALALEAAAPLALLHHRLRAPMWLGLLGLQIGLLALVDFADLTWGMLVLQLWSFDPSWLASVRTQQLALRPCTDQAAP